MAAAAAIAPSTRLDAPVDLQINDAWRRDLPYSGAAAVVDAAAMDEAAQAIASWPGYAPTPLLWLPGLARRLRLGAIACKDESRRFGVGGVKALGAPYGLEVLLRDHDPATPFTAIAATDGNHGLALAWAARRRGGRAAIFVGRDVDAVRLKRIRDQGAEIEVIDGTYDDAVLAAERAAEEPGCLLVTDTDYVGDHPVVRAIMAGYGVLAAEAWAAGLADAPPSHVFLHCGVGGMAGGVTAGLWRRTSPATPRVVTVEPAAAACALASLRAGRSTAVGGSLRTRMAGLACGRLSLPAWEILSRAAAAALAIGDGLAAAVQRDLSTGAFGDPPLATGDTGVAGLAGLIAAACDAGCRERLALGPGSRVLVVNSEGPLPA